MYEGTQLLAREETLVFPPPKSTHKQVVYVWAHQFYLLVLLFIIEYGHLDYMNSYILFWPLACLY
jgi:hypothetical protein